MESKTKVYAHEVPPRFGKHVPAGVQAEIVRLWAVMSEADKAALHNCRELFDDGERRVANIVMRAMKVRVHE